MAAGNKHLAYKEALNAVETTSPGAKHAFYHEFLVRAADRFVDDDDQPGGVGADSVCTSCGAPSTNEVCAFCTLVARAREAEPVTIGPTRRSGR